MSKETQDVAIKEEAGVMVGAVIETAGVKFGVIEVGAV